MTDFRDEIPAGVDLDATITAMAQTASFTLC